MFNIASLMSTMIGVKGKNNAVDMNMLTFQDYYDRLQCIGLSLFEWTGLPKSCNERYLEKTLFMYGKAIFVNDDTLGYLNLRCTGTSELNNYDEPVSWQAYGNTYGSKEYKNSECVIIRNNIIEKPTNESVILFTTRLCEAERTIDVNIKSQKTPTMIYTDEKSRLSMANIWNKYDGNEPLIMADKRFNPESIKVFKTDAPFVADKLQVYKRDIWNEVLTFYGLNNTNSDKKERLIVDEVNANNEVISVNAETMLLTRQQACVDINKMFTDLNVSVKMRNFKESEEESEWQDTQSNSEQ